ncbi:MAG: hypothetical protein ACLTS6_07430 [Anaerobutyricum sp.]
MNCRWKTGQGRGKKETEADQETEQSAKGRTEQIGRISIRITMINRSIR